MASADVAYQGYAASDVDLNLPNLPDLSDVVTLLDGDTDQYTWYRSAGQWRADLLTDAGEEDTYQTSQGTFVWNYQRNLMTQIVGAQPVRLPRAADLLPPNLGRRLLGFAGHASVVSRLASQRVAGVDAAGLRIQPAASQQTTIGAVEIWADPANGLPVQVEIFGRGAATPVLVTRFLDLSMAKPALASVTPSPAPEVGYSIASLPDVSRVLDGFGPPLPDRLAGLGQVSNPGVLGKAYESVGNGVFKVIGVSDLAAYGTGFARFVVLPLPLDLGNEAMTKAASVGASISISGGTAVLVRTPLLTVVLAASPGGPVYLLTGAVTATLLERAATDLVAAQ